MGVQLEVGHHGKGAHGWVYIMWAGLEIGRVLRWVYILWAGLESGQDV